MARIKLTRAVNVRRYSDYVVDTDDLTPVQLAALEQVGDPGGIESQDVLDTLDSICDNLDPEWEDYEDNLEWDQRVPTFKR